MIPTPGTRAATSTSTSHAWTGCPRPTAIAPGCFASIGIRTTSTSSATTRASKVLKNEQEPTWIDVESDKITFLNDGKHFVWQSETSGYNHLYLHKNNGDLVTPITSGEWDVTAFHGIDETTDTAYFTAAIDNPLERHLYSIKIDMEGDDEDARTSPPVKITQQPGTHNVNMSSDLRYYIDTYSNATTPSTVTLHRRRRAPTEGARKQ